MADRFAVEAVDRLLRDLTSNRDLLFGGKTVVFAGDFRQVLPVLPGQAPETIIGRTVKFSPLWCRVTTRRLTKNLRLTQSNSDEKDFADWLEKYL